MGVRSLPQIAMLAAVLCGCESLNNPAPHVYVLPDRALTTYLQRYGFRGDDFQVIWSRPQDSKFAVRELGDGDIYVVSAQSGPRRIETRHRGVCLGADGEIAAWYDSFTDEGVHFRNGATRRFIGSTFQPSEDGSVFLQSDRTSGQIAVFDLDQPDKPLFTFLADPARFNPDDVFVLNDRIFLVDDGNRAPGAQNCWVFARKGQTYEKEGGINIPGTVASTIPWSNSLVINERHDFPLPHQTFIFELASRSRTHLGYLLNKGAYVLWDDWTAIRPQS